MHGPEGLIHFHVTLETLYNIFSGLQKIVALVTLKKN